jgi:histidine triad (HIT) family protein
MSDCVFCKISAGELPATKVHENDDFLAFADLDPKADTHVLVIPRAHHANVADYVDAGGSSDAMLAFVVETARAAGVDGRYRLIANSGPEAGQTVFHLHWHILAGGRLPGF